MAIKTPYIADIVNEFKFTTSQSGGPGGQHVNRVNTKVTLRWSVISSIAIVDDQRQIILKRLAKIINNEGEVVIMAQANRSQRQNREEVVRKLELLLTDAFSIRKVRRATKPTKASVQRRLNAKKKLSEKKKLRGGVD